MTDAIPKSPFEALVTLLEGGHLESLDTFVAANQEEGQHLEYKDPRLLEDRVKAKREIRRQVNALGNSEGGLLVIGVTESRPREIVACSSAPEGKSLKEWMYSLLSPMAKDFSPPPRIHVMPRESGQTVVVAVPRAPHLFPVVEGGEALYYIRFGDKSIPMPPSHVADLLVGRRQVPRLELWVTLERAPNAQGEEVQVTVKSGVHNMGLLAAERVEGGIVCWAAGPPQQSNRALLEHIDIVEPIFAGYVPDTFGIRHERCVVSAPSRMEAINARLAPFAASSLEEMRVRLPFAKFAVAPLQYTAAFYLLSSGATPTWFECDFSFPALLPETVVTSRPVYGRRPRVQVSPLALNPGDRGTATASTT